MKLKFCVMKKFVSSILLILIVSSFSVAQIKRAPIKYHEDSLKTVHHDTIDEHYVEFNGIKFFTLKFGVNSFPFGSNTVEYLAGTAPNNYVGQSDFQYGKGYEIKANYGKYISENIGIEWNFQALIGGKNSISYRYSDSSLNLSVSSSYSVNSFLTGPSVTYQSKGEYWFPYFRAGLLLGFSQKNINETAHVFQNSGGYIGKFKQITSEYGGYTTGYTIDFGIMKKIDKKHLLFVEVGYNNLNQSFKNATVDEATFNGNDVLYSYSTQEKETIFVDKLSSTSNTDPNKPLEIEKYKTILNSIGIKFGCKFLLY